MKKIIGIGVVVVISMIVSAVLFAAEPPRFNAQGRGAGFRTVGFIDNDGVCDYCPNASCTGFVDELDRAESTVVAFVKSSLFPLAST